MAFIPARTPIRKKRKGKPRAGRLNKKDKAILRQQCFDRDEGICQVCMNPVDPNSWHMAHWRNRRMWGDNLDNVATTHSDCHLIQLHNPKSVPAKEKL